MEEKKTQQQTPKKTGRLFSNLTKGRIAIFFTLCVVVVGILYLLYPKAIKIEQEATPRNRIWQYWKESTQDDSISLVSVNEYRGGKEGDSGKNRPSTRYKSSTEYHLYSTRAFTAKETKTYLDQDRQETNFFYVRPLCLEDAKEVHEAVKKSGEKHFGKYMKSFFENYGLSEWKARQCIINESASGHSETMGVFHATAPNEEYKLVGFIGCSKASDQKRHEHLRAAYNVFYAMCSKEVTKLRSTMPLVLYGYQALIFRCTSSFVKKIILNIHENNGASQSVAKKLGYTYLGKGNDPHIICYDENQRIKDMQVYILTLEEWKKKYARAWKER